VPLTSVVTMCHLTSDQSFVIDYTIISSSIKYNNEKNVMHFKDQMHLLTRTFVSFCLFNFIKFSINHFFCYCEKKTKKVCYPYYLIQNKIRFKYEINCTKIVKNMCILLKRRITPTETNVCRVLFQVTSYVKTAFFFYFRKNDSQITIRSRDTLYYCL
jgi:hypothetical protein